MRSIWLQASSWLWQLLRMMSLVSRALRVLLSEVLLDEALVVLDDFGVVYSLVQRGVCGRVAERAVSEGEVRAAQVFGVLLELEVPVRRQGLAGLKEGYIRAWSTVPILPSV